MGFIALSPNLALDRILRLNKAVEQGTLHRVTEVREGAGGKAVNVARVLNTLGAEVTIAGFLAGFNGQKFRSLLQQEGLAGIFQEVAGETRECHILLAGQVHPTEVYEPGPTVLAGDWQALVRQLPEGKVIISGSLSPGLAPPAFAEMLRELPSKPVIDASGPMLRVALESAVALVKPNRAELASITPVQGDGVAEAEALYQSYGVPILLSLGADGAAYIAEQTLRVYAPSISVNNPVASGDSLLAAFIWAQSEGWSLDDALRLGVAAGTENAASGGGARFAKDPLFKRWLQV
jgi:1-phosphofructokinase family hexose kinase